MSGFRHAIVRLSGSLVPRLPALLFTVLCSLFSLPACGGPMKGKSTAQIYAEALGEGAKEVVEPLKENFEVQQPLGYEEPVVPIMMPPRTILVWIPSHRIDRRIFVHGHWLTVVVRDWDWNPEIELMPGDAQPSAVETLLPLHPESKPPEGK
ncbi:MAG: hypothetical protein HYY13_11070 [Nitrospirae bacterium]|nr:hypothetical protein [Nitrospirota bacterium]